MSDTKPSIKKISEATGFSPSTVSNALNRKPGVNRDTVERILEAADEMGYSKTSRGLKSVKFVQLRTTGEILDGSSFHLKIIEGVEQAAQEYGLSTLFVSLDMDAPDFEDQISRLSLDLSCGVIALAAELSRDDIARLLPFRAPLVLLDRTNEGLPVDAVPINNEESGWQAGAYLIGRGHRDIGYIGGDFRIRNFQERKRGLRTALMEHDLMLRPEWTVLVGTLTETAYHGMLKWLEGNPELPTAFFADNDVIALGAMKALIQSGIRIPEDVSLIGFDGVSYGAVSTPALTTFKVHKRSMGWAAVNHLMSLASHKPGCSCQIQCCTNLIERESVRTLKPGEVRP